MPRRRVLIWAFAVSLLSATLLSCDGGDKPPAKKKQESVPKTAFKVAEIRGLDAQDRPEAGQRAIDEAPKVVNLLNSYYALAFVDPTKWQAGSHPELASLFAADVHPHLGPQLGALALAELVPKISKVKPTKQEAPRITFLIEGDLSAPYAMVTVLFEATATAKVRADSPVKLAHTATFWLVRDADVYKIIGFNTHLVADSEIKSAELDPPDWVMRG